MSQANLETEKLFLAEVRAGNLIVSKSGTITNARTGHVFEVRDGEYKQITFSINGEKRYILAHRLVWIAFNGLIEDPSIEVNHNNGIKSKNGIANLELMTRTENMAHAFETGLLDSFSHRGEKHGRSKFTDEDVVRLRMVFSQGNFTLQDFADQNSVALSTMHSLLSNKTWKHLVTGYEEAGANILFKNRTTLNNRRL